MHKNPQFTALFEFDSEIEMTFQRLKSHRQFEQTFAKAIDGEEAQRGTFRNFVTPKVHS